MSTIDDMKSRARQIKTAQIKGENTADRVGGLLYDMIDYIDDIEPEQIQSDWNESDAEEPSYIKNKPVIPSAQVQSNWNESDPTNVAYIKNKPIIPSGVIVDASLSKTSENPVQNKVIALYLESLQQQINELNARVAGVVLTVSPQSIQMISSNISITVTAEAEISSVVVYRGNTEIGRSATHGKLYSFTDVVTPQSTDNIVYRAEVTVSGVVITKEAVVTVASEQHLNVLVGHGADYASAQFTDTGRGIGNNMIVSVNRNAGDYVFIKVDSRDTVNNLYTYPGPHMEDFEYVVALDSPVVDGSYKYYKTTNRYNAGEIQYKINKA